METDGPEEQKLLSGQPSTGFLPTNISIATVRGEYGVDALSPGVLVWDAKTGTTPPNWRATDALDSSLASQGVNTTGLDTLHVAGSGMYDKRQFAEVQRIAGALQAPLIVLALRQEPTGFVGDAPFSMFGFADNAPNDWSNAGLSDRDAEARNRAILQAVAGASSVTLYPKSALKAAIQKGQLPPPEVVTPADVMSEEAFVSGAGAQFESVMITDHGVPTFAAVDSIVDVITEASAAGGLLYIHCAGGDGRTTTVMAMADMLQNASNGVSADEILKRQLAIGGEDLTDTSDPGARGELQKARLQLLQRFYAYAQENPYGEGVRFSEWAQARGIDELLPSYGDSGAKP